MPDAYGVLRALRAFVASMESRSETTPILDELSRWTTEALGASGAGVSVEGADNRLEVISATSESIRELESIQERLQEGPCVTVFATARPLVVPDLRATDQWPSYSNEVAHHPFPSFLGYPLLVDDRRMAVLDVYHSRPGEWTEESVEVVSVFADVAAAGIACTSALERVEMRAGQLQEALDSRIIIEQAKGILAGEYQISVDEAFERLRRHSRDHNLVLTDVCRAVVRKNMSRREMA